MVLRSFLVCWFWVAGLVSCFYIRFSESVGCLVICLPDFLRVSSHFTLCLVFVSSDLCVVMRFVDRSGLSLDAWILWQSKRLLQTPTGTR